MGLMGAQLGQVRLGPASACGRALRQHFKGNAESLRDLPLPFMGQNRLLPRLILRWKVA